MQLITPENQIVRHLQQKGVTINHLINHLVIHLKRKVKVQNRFYLYIELGSYKQPKNFYFQSNINMIIESE